MDIMKLFLAASPNPFDLKAALLQGHAQHPVIIHFSDCAFYSKRCLRVTGGLAQATGFCIGRLLQSRRCRVDPPPGDRHWLGSVAMATRRRDPQGQLTAAYDLRADFGVANLLSLLDAFAPPRERHPAACRLFRSDIARADVDHAHWTSRWNPQRR